VAVASAGLYASLNLIPDNHASIPPLSFLQAGCPSCRPTNSVKALKAIRNEKELSMFGFCFVWVPRLPEFGLVRVLVKFVKKDSSYVQFFQK